MPKGQYDRSLIRTPPTIPSIKEICQQIPNELSAITFLTSHGILKTPKETTCCICGYKGCRAKSKATPKSLKCNRKECGKSQSVLQQTIFAGSKMPLHQMLYLAVFWLFESPTAVVKVQIHCTPKSISDFYKRFRQMVAKIVFLDNERMEMRDVNHRMDETMAVSIWRGRYAANLWNAFLEALGRLRYCKEIGFFEANVDVALPGDDGGGVGVGYPPAPGMFQEYYGEHCPQQRIEQLHYQNGPHQCMEQLYYQNGPQQGSEQLHHQNNNQRSFGYHTELEDECNENGSQSMAQLHHNDGPQQSIGQLPFEDVPQQSFCQPQEDVTPDVAAVATAAVAAMWGEPPPLQQHPKEKKTNRVKQKRSTQSKQFAIPHGQKQPHSVFTFGEVGKPEPEQNINASKRPRKVQSIPSFMDICCKIPTEEKAIEFLISNGIFTHPNHTTCSHCGYVGFRVKGKSTPKSLKCNRCSKGTSLMKGTFFEGIRAPLQQILYMSLFWLSLSPVTTIVTQLRCSSATVTDISNKLRNLINCYMEKERGTQARQYQLANNSARLKRHIPKFARKEFMDDHVCVAMWREMNAENLWEALLLVLQTVKNNDNGPSAVKAYDEPWVDEKSGKACCKYHSRIRKMQQQVPQPLVGAQQQVAVLQPQV